MHRVELKVSSICINIAAKFKFLMHRVELKALENQTFYQRSKCVPNAPCGVESLKYMH